MVVKTLTWLHELVYTVVGQHTIYEELPIPLFISWYLVILDNVKPTL